MSNIDRLVQALKDEFGGEEKVALHLALPASLTAPSVIVSPGDPFIEPDGYGEVRETWDVMVVYNPTAPDRNIHQIRRISLRIRKAVSSVGGLYERTTGPRIPNNDANSPVRLLINEISFTYNADNLLEETND